jgi:hypothetical protein
VTNSSEDRREDIARSHLCKCPHENVNIIRVDSRVLTHTPPCAPKGPNRVGLVYVDVRLVLLANSEWLLSKSIVLM